LLALQAAAQPARIAIVRSGVEDALARETTTRLEAELTAAGYAVILVDAADEPSAAATVAVVANAGAALPEVWVLRGATRRHVELATAPDSSTPAALAIRAVELVRASLLEAHPTPPPSHVEGAPPETSSEVRPEAVRAPRGEKRGALERVGVEVGLTAIYGLGDTAGRLAPTFRFSYGSARGLAARLTVIGPTGADQLAVAELAYAFDRWSRVFVPIVSLGAGGMHTHLDDTATPMHPHLRTEAWAGVVSANLGLAVRATPNLSALLDGHALLAVPVPGAIVGAEPAGGRPTAAGTISLGVLAIF
jgi:hypothetical protein